MPTKQFNKLQNIWYKKLKESGFHDIENNDESLDKNGLLTSARFNDRMSPDTYKNKEMYYQLAGQFLHENIFPTKLHKTIWELHAEGLSGRDISEKIGVLKKTEIYKTINTLKEQMLKKYIGANSEQE